MTAELALALAGGSGGGATSAVAPTSGAPAAGPLGPQPQTLSPTESQIAKRMALRNHTALKVPACNYSDALSSFTTTGRWSLFPAVAALIALGRKLSV